MVIIIIILITVTIVIQSLFHTNAMLVHIWMGHFRTLQFSSGGSVVKKFLYEVNTFSWMTLMYLHSPTHTCNVHSSHTSLCTSIKPRIMMYDSA